MGEYFQLLGWCTFCVFVFFLAYERTLDYIAHRKQRREWERLQNEMADKALARRRRIHQQVDEDR